jgi:CRISPR/Cas system CSM-associated protein Csm3 (group 7 of RAMP superfamily)
MNAQWNNPRGLKERIFVKGDLVLVSPTHLGNGDADSPLDMPLIRDELEERALLTGTSIAGALRGFLSEIDHRASESLFGKVNAQTSEESLLIVDDALGDPPIIEIRDGVAINPRTRTAQDKAKYDIELLAAGTRFPLRFELLVVPGKEQLIEWTAQALKGLEQGEIYLGKRKRRGFGQCKVIEWTVWRFRLDGSDASGLINWLEWDGITGGKSGKEIDQLLLNRTIDLPQRESLFELEATFALRGSILIRSASGESPELDGKSIKSIPDAVHLTSRREDGFKAVVSGTSIGGVLRAQALRIANTLGKDGIQITNDLFGLRPDSEGDPKNLTASRMWVEESVIQSPVEYVQNRVKIDRFTGGAYPGALFSEQPVFPQSPQLSEQSGETQFKMRLKVRHAQDSDVGLVLLLLKDLWTGNLPLGGERSIGRGRLIGQKAVIHYKGKNWQIDSVTDDQLQLSDNYEDLQKFVDAFTGGETA